jgi:arginine deiminase
MEVYATLTDRHLATVVHSPYREDEGVLTSSSERGVLHITWAIADHTSFVTTFREVGNPVAYRKASITEGLEML